MTPASLKTQIIWLEDRIVNLEKRLDQVERLNKPPTKPITTRKLSSQWGWTLIDGKRLWVGLTEEERNVITDKVIGFNSCVGWEDDYAKAIEAALKEKNGG